MRVGGQSLFLPKVNDRLPDHDSGSPLAGSGSQTGCMQSTVLGISAGRLGGEDEVQEASHGAVGFHGVAQGLAGVNAVHVAPA